MANEKTVRKVSIVNKFGPFDRDITGKSLYQLGRLLQEKGCMVTYICVKESDKSNAPESDKKQGIGVHYIRGFKFGNKPALRLMGAMAEVVLLFLRTLFTSSDVIIVMTAPPLMNYFGGWLKKLTRRRIIFWTMDLYPEAFVSSKLIEPTSSVYKLMERAVYKNPPHALIALGENQLHFLLAKYKHAFKTFTLPCGVQTVDKTYEQPSWIKQEDIGKIKFCYAGNIGEAHDEIFLTELASLLNPAIHKLYINLYGTKAERVLKTVAHLSAVQQIPFLNYAQMHFINVHVVSLLPEWDQVCVPSKAVSAVCAGAVLLLNSSKQYDGYRMFESCSFTIETNSIGYCNSISSFLKQLNVESIAVKEKASVLIARRLQSEHYQSLEAIAAFITETE